MKFSHQQRACGSIRLDLLLFGDEESVEFREYAHHVESCAPCQDRLSKLAGGDADWAEVRGRLRPDQPPNNPFGQERGGAPVSGATGTRPDAGKAESTIDAGFARESSRHVKIDFLAPPSHPELLGRLGRYEISEVIGAGGMGIVLKGFDSELNRPVAIKVLAPHLAHSGAARQRFAREVRAAAAVVHEHVVAIHNVESEHEVPFFVMQYVAGRSLQERVEQEGPLDATEILRIGMQAAAGLAAAHAQGVIHRDVKPANLLLENGVDRAILTDFGLARAADDASLTHSGIVAGTPHYMAPEQARGEPADARSDLFSLGAMLYFMAAGHAPFRAEQAMAVLHRICHDRHRALWEINGKIPDELAHIIDRLLEKKPSRRFASAAEVQQALALELSRIQDPRRGGARRWLRRLGSPRWQFRIVAVNTALAVAALAAALFVRHDDSTFPVGSATGSSADSTSPSMKSTSISPLTNGTSPQPAEFVRELHEIDQALKRLELRPHPESLLVPSGPDTWFKEAKAAGVVVSRLERSWSVDAP